MYPSKSSNLQEKEEKQINKKNENDSNQNNQKNSTYINMDLTKENLNIKLILNQDKISNLLIDSDNNDKIVNISKLDEDLDYGDKKNKKGLSSKIKKLENTHLEGFKPEANNYEKPTINNNYINDTHISNSILNDINKNNDKNDNNIKVVNKKESKNYKKKNKINYYFSKIPIYYRIILFLILFIIAMLLILLIIIKNKK